MNKIFAAVIGAGVIAVLVSTGCVKTVTGDYTGGIKWKDRVEGRYERPLDDVYKASKDVLIANGSLNKESTLHTETNTVRTVEGKVNERLVFVRVEGVDPKTTAVVVQTRTTSGGSDIDLAHEIEKQIALKLQLR